MVKSCVVYSCLNMYLKLTNTVDFLTGLTAEQTSVGKNQDHISTRHPSVLERVCVCVYVCGRYSNLDPQTSVLFEVRYLRARCTFVKLSPEYSCKLRNVIVCLFYWTNSSDHNAWEQTDCRAQTGLSAASAVSLSLDFCI